MRIVLPEIAACGSETSRDEYAIGWGWAREGRCIPFSVVHSIMTASSQPSQKRDYRTKWPWLGQEWCSKQFRDLLGITRNKFKDWCCQIKKGEVLAVPPDASNHVALPRDQPARRHVRAWLRWCYDAWAQDDQKSDLWKGVSLAFCAHALPNLSVLRHLTHIFVHPSAVHLSFQAMT